MPPDGTELKDVFVDGDGFPAPPGLFADDVPVRFVAPGAEGSFEGPEALQEGWADWLEPWESYVMSTDEIVDQGDRVVALTRLRGVTKHGGVEMEHEAAAVFRFEGDQVVDIEFNLDRDDALKG